MHPMSTYLDQCPVSSIFCRTARPYALANIRSRNFGNASILAGCRAVDISASCIQSLAVLTAWFFGEMHARTVQPAHVPDMFCLLAVICRHKGLLVQAAVLW